MGYDSGTMAIIIYLVIAITILLIIWFAIPVFAVAMFIWFLFAGVILSLMICNGERTALSYFFVLVFTFPIMAIVLGAFSYYALE